SHQGVRIDRRCARRCRGAKEQAGHDGRGQKSYKHRVLRPRRAARGVPAPVLSAQEGGGRLLLDRTAAAGLTGCCVEETRRSKSAPREKKVPGFERSAKLSFGGLE